MAKDQDKKVALVIGIDHDLAIHRVEAIGKVSNIQVESAKSFVELFDQAYIKGIIGLVAIIIIVGDHDGLDKVMLDATKTALTHSSQSSNIEVLRITPQLSEGIKLDQISQRFRQIREKN